MTTTNFTTTINNFTLVGIYDEEKLSNNLLDVNNTFDILSFKVYPSNINNNLYVVYDRINKKYYSFEGNGNSTDHKTDLTWNIKVYLIGTLP